MALQPFGQLAATGGLGLHLFERSPTCLTGRQLALQALQFALHGLASGLQLRHFLLQLLQVFLVTGEFLAQQLQFFFLLGQRQFVGRLAEGFLAQAFAALDDRLQRALGVRLVGLLDFQLLLAVGRARLQPLQFFQGLRMIFLDLWRQVHLRMQALLGLLDAQAGDFLRFFPAFPIDGEFLGRLRPVRQFVFQLHQPGFKLAARFATMADFRFQPRDLSIGRVHLALRVVQGVTGSEMGFAGFLGTRLGFAQRGALRFEFGGRPLDIQCQALALGLGFALFQQPQQLLFLHQLLVERVIAASNLGLGFQAFDLVAKFLADVLDAQQVLAGVFKTPLGFLAPFLVAGDTGRFFEEDAQVVGARLDDARDHALADDRVGARPQPGTQEEIGDVLAPDLQVVDEVIRLPLPGQHALDRQFGVLRPLAHGPAERVVEDQFDGRARHRLAVGRAVEDHVHHRLATQLRGFRLAQHPAHRVHDVRLAATVRPDDADQLPRQGHRGRIDEGLEAGEFEFGQAHARSQAGRHARHIGGRMIASSPRWPLPAACPVFRNRPLLLPPTSLRIVRK